MSAPVTSPVAERIERLLEEMRDAQRDHLAWSREVTQRSLAAQQTAIDVARRSARLYRIVVSVAAVLVAALLVLLFSLLP